MKAKVLISFCDKQNNAIQHEGKIIELTEERFDEIMASNENLIEEVDGEDDSPNFPRHTGGGYYELSNGEKVKGKDAANIAQEGINYTND